MTLTHKTILTTLITISLLLLLAHTTYAATYYVDTNNAGASDSNTGTEASPWKTIQHAADTLVAGDTVYVKAGTYREGQAIQPKNSGTSDSNRITFEVFQGDTVVIEGEWNGVYKNNVVGVYDQPGHGGFRLAPPNDNYITIKGFEITNTWGSGIRMGFSGNSTDFHENNIIEGNSINGIHGVWGGNIAGIKVNSCRNCTVKDNTVANIYTTDASGSEVGELAGQNTDGILGYVMPGTHIENNEVSYAEQGIYHKRAPSITSDIVVNNNIIHDVFFGVKLGIAGAGDPPHLNSSVYNNIIYNVNSGIISTTGWSSTSKDLYIHDNIFYNVGTSFSYRFYKDVEVYNNILAAGSDGISAKLYNYKCDQLAELNYSDYNIFTPATGTKGFALYAGCGTNGTEVVATSFIDWQSKLALPSAGLMISNPDANSFEASESDIFVNATAGDFTFTSNGASLVNAAGRYGDDIGVLACSVGPHADCTNPPPPSDTTPPTASAGSDQSATTNQQITVDGSASTDNTGITSYSWDFMASDGIQSDATGSTATHTYTTQGSYTVTLTVQDAAGNTGTDTLVVTVNNPSTPPPPAQCSDNLDNDGDGKTDYPNDPGCTSSTDTDEYNTPPTPTPSPTPGGGGTTPTITQCNDNLDNDGDGYVDFGSDRDCTSKSDTTEGISKTPTVDTPVTIDDGGIDTTTGIAKRFSTLYGPFAFGHRTAQVTLLQQILASDPSIYPEGEITGYYGRLTVKAVQTFQCKYLSLCSGTPSSNGYGLAGPSTREKINTVFQQNTPTVTTTTTTLDQATRDAIQAQINALNAILLTLLEQLAVLLAEGV